MAGLSHSNLSLISMIFLSGSLVMLWFIILSGVTSTPPLRQTFFLRADTNGITGAKPVSQWTYFYICGPDNTDCGPAHPALPLGSAWESNPRNAPEELVGNYGDNTTSFTYWYMWRFGWVFFLLALFFEVVTFFAGFLACCSRLGSAISGLIALTALLFYSVAVSLMTATFVKTRNAFVSAGRPAELGTYAFGFAWGGWAALFISSILFCISRHARKQQGTSASAPRWRRRKSVRSTRSYDGRRVKDEYS
ncbi:SUR7/PalI family-domain-containing protein [Rhypophila decipiens]|uniref:SUR7/PalI family-domain-containing protein n=1 Tax=Rhypophila decipiens TaxID=261697 RepID=A0AAN6YIA2_9PEZI|nr:SUR7/PalI family-domain-containing protein [Rhypophila decipiens]